MSVHVRNTIPVGVIYARPEKIPSESVRVAETVYIDDGDAVAVMVAKTALGVVPVIVPIPGDNERRESTRAKRSKHPTMPAPAPKAMDLRNPGSRRPPPRSMRVQKRSSQFRVTLRPKAQGE